MPAPTAEDGLKRAMKIAAVPSILVLFLVVLAHHFFDAVIAGFVLNISSIIALFGIALAATYWNIEYTAMIGLGTPVIYVLTPAVFSGFVHPANLVIERILIITFAGYIVVLAVTKIANNW